MKVLVTGAAGRVGANVVRRLLGSGADVRALVMPGDPHAAKLDALSGTEVVVGDLRDSETVRMACRGVTHVVHLAAQMIRGSTPVDEFYDVNALSTLRLVEAARDTGVQRFVLASTDATLRPGDTPPVPLTEDAPQWPANHYGLSKLLSETILRNRAGEYGIPYAIVRFATVLSPEEAGRIFRLSFLRGWAATQHAAGMESTVWPLLADEAMVRRLDAAESDLGRDPAVVLTGPDGPWQMSVVDVRDAAQGVHLAVTQPGAARRSFNIAAAEPTSFADGAAAVSEHYAVPKITVEMPTTWRLHIGIDAACEHLGYRPVHDYRSTLTSTDADDYVPAAEGDEGVYARLSGQSGVGG